VNGSVIANRYELGERLGTGGMSTVQLAFDRRLERNVAVKLLAEHLAEDAQFVARFRREALAAARLVHPNIVQVFDFGLDDSSGRHYIVMEHIEGQSAAEILRDRGHLPVAEALAIVNQSCRGLDYAHRNGVVHRDVKPGNLLRTADGGVVKLADFGIAKALTDESSITQVGSVLGTAAYLAPEQASGEEAGPRADLYALGVVTYQLLSGRLPYEASSLTELALKQQREIPPRLDELNREVTPELAAAVDRALALDPRARYESADAMREALTDGARGIGPATSATRAVVLADADVTSATRVAERSTAEHEAPAPPPARVARQPRPAPPGYVAAPAGAAAAGYAGEPAPRRRSRVRRFFLWVFLLLLVAGAAAVAVVIATSADQSAVELRQVVHDELSQTLEAVRQLIEDNIR
jgi:serine/threonine-protein kinase